LLTSAVAPAALATWPGVGQRCGRLTGAHDNRTVDEYDVDAGLYLFDCRKFRERVVPAFRRLHGTDEVEPLLAQVWRSAGTGSAPVPRFTPHLRRVTAPLMVAPDLTGYLPAELAVPDPPRTR
jgi:hypothetical protein